MELADTVDPIAFEAWISENFSDTTNAPSQTKDPAVMFLIANAVMDPQVTILSRALAETGIDEIHARMTIALMQGFLRTRTGLKGDKDVETC